MTRQNFGSRGVTAAVRWGGLFTGDIFRRRRGQRSPVRDVATIMQYDSGTAFVEHSQRVKQPSRIAGTARCLQTDARRPQAKLKQIIYRYVDVLLRPGEVGPETLFTPLLHYAIDVYIISYRCCMQCCCY